METPKWHWKYGLDIPLDVDERIAIEKALKDIPINKEDEDSI